MATVAADFAETSADGPVMVDIDEFLDGLAISAFHWRALALGVTIMIIDGYEVGLLGLVLPALAKSFGVAPAALTWVLSAQQVGMVLGAYFVAPLADRFGRRPIVLLALAGVGVSSLASLGVEGLTGLAACRLVTGIFASTLIASLVSWTSEIAPARARTIMVACVLAGSIGGGVVGSLAQAFVLERFGWQGAFWIGSVVPLLLVPIGLRWFEESPAFLVARRPGDRRLDAVARLGGFAPGTLQLRAPALGEAGGRSVADLFRSGLAMATVLLWLAFLFDFLFISGWFWKTTIYLDRLRMNWDQIAMATSVEVLFGGLGILSVGVVTARVRLSLVIPFYYLGAALCIAALGTIATTQVFFAVLALMAVLQNAGHTGLALIASSLYPARFRATGVGWAYGAGRVASIFGPPIGAMAMAHDMFFGVLAVCLAFAAISVIALFRTGSVGPAGPAGHGQANVSGEGDRC